MLDNLDPPEFTRAKVIKLVDDLEFGVAENKNKQLMFFHISNFIDTIAIEDIVVGDIISGQAQVQKSDGRLSLINCSRLDQSQYLREYFRSNIIKTDRRLEDYNEFMDNCKLYASYLKAREVDIADLVELKTALKSGQSLADFKALPDLIDSHMEGLDNKALLDFFQLLKDLIGLLRPDAEKTRQLKYLKAFMESITSYIQII